MEKEKDLDIKPTPLEEDCFYLLLAIDGEISKEHGEKLVRRINGHTQEEYEAALDVAQRMIANVKKYGIPCKEWE